MARISENPNQTKAEQAFADRVPDDCDSTEGYEDCYADGSLKNECWNHRRSEPKKIQNPKPR